MSEKALSRSPLNFFRRSKHSTQEGSEETKNGDNQDGTAFASPVESATLSESTAESSMVRVDVCKPSQSSPTPASMELRCPDQVA